MIPQQADKLGIDWMVVYENKLKYVERYVDLRFSFRKAIWYPCLSGFVCFGIDAINYLKSEEGRRNGYSFKYFGVSAALTKEPFNNAEWHTMDVFYMWQYQPPIYFDFVEAGVVCILLNS